MSPITEFMLFSTSAIEKRLGVVGGTSEYPVTWAPAFTSILQSASAAVGILQALAITGAVTFEVAFPIIMGIAIGAGADVALDAADVVLMKSTLLDVPAAIRLSRAALRNIHENLFWAFFYNCIGIPLAAGVLYPSFEIRLNPMFGAAAMSLSSIFVVGNALRLRGFKSGFTPLKTGTPEAARTEQETTQAAVEGEQCILEAPAEQNSKEEKERTNTMTKVISIEGMMCSHCTGTVQKALEAVEGVKAVTMSLEQKNATVELASDVADEVLTKAVVDVGYEVKGVTEK